MKTFFRLMLVCCSFFLATHQVQSQTRYIELSIQNITQPSATEIEYEVWVKNNSPADVAKLCFLQYGMDLPIGLSGGGTLSISKVAWDPAFNGTSWGQAGNPMISGQPNDPTIRVPSQTGNSSTAVTIPTTGNGIMYGRYKITNSIPFPANTYLFFDVVKNSFPSTKTRTSVSAYLNGSMSPSAYTYLGSLFYIDSLFVLGNAPLLILGCFRRLPCRLVLIPSTAIRGDLIQQILFRFPDLHPERIPSPSVMIPDVWRKILL
jgi:hypothetical protein